MRQVFESVIVILRSVTGRFGFALPDGVPDVPGFGVLAPVADEPGFGVPVPAADEPGFGVPEPVAAGVPVAVEFGSGGSCVLGFRCAEGPVSPHAVVASASRRAQGSSGRRAYATGRSFQGM
jgi:hypothetical protein